MLTRFTYVDSESTYVQLHDCRINVGSTT
uniref:Uncharacterized protein n=1 Tax=Anguilla anguilla TaxID=7936 RepID=A0A0E9QF68_ANGAN